MEFSTREDIEAPLDRVFAALTDFDRIERQVMRRGIEVQRTDTRSEPGEGMAWTASFRFRGKPREAEVTLTEYDPPNLMVYRMVSGGLEARTRLDFVALSPSRTRIAMTIEVTAKTLSARLIVQSIKLARANVEKRFRVRMAEYAGDLETRLKRQG
ncbi:SRPBCC family protein [Salipiger mucosus]|uniref:DNA polymerase III subunits gamma and tau n=1 Tax=Salipiger mucosus DSM 16094 TaxID=1123237 RepID=S9QIZ3_9RHOB|nr:SRPBCC family protein [Salipiger mucosus]EPX79533.1 hypothetical protein Salmuc_04752 [Salipiger mucosus DSM 16094]